MTEKILFEIALIFIGGITAQWLAWRLHLPSILILLLLGFALGPITGLLKPNELLGDLLFPIVSASVAIILFEGGLSLKTKELHDAGHVIRNLVTVGLLITWGIITLAALFLFDFRFGLASLLGAVLVVTGPTVILPILRHVRPKGQISSILKWEGMLNDPIGAALAVLVFEAILATSVTSAAAVAIVGLLKTVLIGVTIGAASAFLLILFFRRNWVPDFLHNTFTLAIVITAFVTSNHFQEETGLLTVTLFGAILANQRFVAVKHIIEFKENLRILLISSLFIILAARLRVDDIASLDLYSLAFLGVVIFIARPISVLVSTIRSEVTWKERLFLSWLAPRGIVAAAVSALFAIRLVEEGLPQAERLVPITFLVIIGTISLQGLSALPLARKLNLAQTNPQGIVIVGAHQWAREIARSLQEAGFIVRLIDSNRRNLVAARMQGLSTHFGNILSEDIMDELELDGIGYLLALTSNDEVNSLAALHFSEIFGPNKVYQLAFEEEQQESNLRISTHLRGRAAFGNAVTFSYIDDLIANGAAVKTTSLTDEFDFAAYRKYYGDKAIPLFLINEKQYLKVFTDDTPLDPQPSNHIISFTGKVDNSEQ